MNIIIGFVLVVLASILIGLNLATMYPNPDYSASWSNVLIAMVVLMVGVTTILRKKNFVRGGRNEPARTQASVSKHVGRE